MWGNVAIRIAMDMSPTNFFEFRATGKCNILLCWYMGMAKMAKTRCVWKGGHQDISPTNSFGFRATGKCNIFLCMCPEPKRS